MYPCFQLLDSKTNNLVESKIHVRKTETKHRVRHNFETGFNAFLLLALS